MRGRRGDGPRRPPPGLGLEPSRVGVASTGVIGLGPRAEPGAGRAFAGAALRSPPAADDFAEAIMTTDRWPKHASLELAPRRGAVRLAAQAKGAGMISPSFATMLCFVETDAAVDEQTLDRLLRCGGRALLRAHLGRRPALHQRLGVHDRERRERSRRWCPVETTSRPSPTRSTRCCGSSRSRWSPTARARPRVARLVVQRHARARRSRSRARSPTRRSCVRPLRRRPELGPGAGGRRPGAARRRRRRSSTSGSRTCRSPAPSEAVALDSTRRQQRSRERDGGGRGGDAASSSTTAEECEIFFCDLGPDYVRDQLGVLVTDT